MSAKQINLVLLLAVLFLAGCRSEKENELTYEQHVRRCLIVAEATMKLRLLGHTKHQALADALTEKDSEDVEWRKELVLDAYSRPLPRIYNNNHALIEMAGKDFAENWRDYCERRAKRKS